MQEKYKKYFESFDLAKVFRDKMVKANDMALANYYETRFLKQREDLIYGPTISPRSIQNNMNNIMWSARSFRDYAKENSTQSLALEGY